MADVSTHCIQAILCLLIVSCYAQNPQDIDPNLNASPNPRVNFDMGRVLGSLVSRLYSSIPSLNADESQVQEREPGASYLQEIKAGRHGSGPLHIYGRHIGHGSRGSSHKLSGAAGGGRDHYSIVDV